MKADKNIKCLHLYYREKPIKKMIQINTNKRDKNYKRDMHRTGYLRTRPLC